MHTAFTIAAICLASPALGQACADRADMARVLAETYHETQRMVAINGSQVVEFWGNDDANTWTMLATDPDGTACVLGAGEGFAIASPGPAGEAL